MSEITSLKCSSRSLAWFTGRKVFEILQEVSAKASYLKKADKLDPHQLRVL